MKNPLEKYGEYASEALRIISELHQLETNAIPSTVMIDGVPKQVWFDNSNIHIK